MDWRKTNCKTRGESFEFSDLVRLISEILRLLPNGPKLSPEPILISYNEYHPNTILFRVRKMCWKNIIWIIFKAWWRHQTETCSALLAICTGNSPVTGEFPTQRAVTRSFDVFFDLPLFTRLSKDSWGWWFERLSGQLWRHSNGFRCISQGIMS